MVVFACYNCKNEKGEATVFKIPDPYSAPQFVCPKCKTPVIVPDKPCGECVCAAQIADENLICCMVSTAEKIMLIPFNMDAGADGVCPHFTRADESFGDDFGGELEDLVEELDNLDAVEDKPTEEKKEDQEEKDEFDEAFDNL